MPILESLLVDIRKCAICEASLPLGARPVLQVSRKAKILIAGQAPGIKVHRTGIPFNDASGNRLRDWMGVSSELFYDPELFAIIPMGFCYPGSGKHGDLPPRPECESTWRRQLLAQLPDLKMTIVLGQYAQAYHFGKKSNSVTELVKSWKAYWPKIVPLPHPSPRNNIWLRNNAWFEKDILPRLKHKISTILEL